MIDYVKEGVVVMMRKETTWTAISSLLIPEGNLLARDAIAVLPRPA